jgi:short-subunit dehydrogenase
MSTTGTTTTPPATSPNQVPFNQGPFNGAVAVITGASAGIGEATARALAARGATVVLAARNAGPLERVASQIRNDGGQALAVPCDMAETADCKRLIAATIDAFGGLDILVNNAGCHWRGPFEQHVTDAFVQMVDVNLRAPIVLTREALPFLIASGRGAVINVASLAGRVPLPGSVVYSATKFGLRAFSLALAEELRGRVKVSLVSPGPVSTGFILDDLKNLTNLTLSQPMRTAEQIAALVVACVEDGTPERVEPPLSGLLTTVSYLFPSLARAIRPFMERKGQRVRDRLTPKSAP